VKPHAFAFSRSRGGVDPRILAAIAVAIAIAVAVIFLLSPEPEPEPIPATAPPLETVAPAQSEAERGDTAREIIDALKSAPGGPDYAEALARAREFLAEGRRADAQLLYFFAARGGDGPAAYQLATFYDPNHYAEGSGLMDKPDPFQAYKWYREAHDAGQEPAAERLAQLRTWAEAASANGNVDAERLLLQWE